MSYLEKGNDKQWQQVTDQYPEVFHEELGSMKGVKARIQVPECVLHMYFQLRWLAYVPQEAVVREIERLQAAGTIVPVTYSEWATSILPIAKTEFEHAETRKLR